MTNDYAIESLERLTETAAAVVRAAVWANAFLVEGGEPTWDAVKSVSRLSSVLIERAEAVALLEDHFHEITP